MEYSKNLAVVSDVFRKTQGKILWFEWLHRPTQSITHNVEDTLENKAGTLKATNLPSVSVGDPLCIRWTGDIIRYEDNSMRFDLKIPSTMINQI